MGVSTSLLAEVIAKESRELSARGYVPLDPFFILKEAEIWDERKKQVLKLDRTLLEKIADIQNRRITESGDFTPIIVGHTNRESSEEHKQKPCGWASRYEVAEFGKDDQNKIIYGLRAVPFTKPENRKLFVDHPRRSVEMWTDPFLIDPISLLGATTPRLDLGLHQLHRAATADGDPLRFETYRPIKPVMFEMGGDGMPDNFGANGNSNDTSNGPSSTDKTSGGANNVLSQVFNSPEWKKQQEDLARCLAVVTQIESLLNDPSGGDMGADAASGMGGQAGPQAGGAMPPPPAGGPTQMSGMGGGAFPGGTNTMIPQQMSGPHQMQRADGHMQFSRGGYSSAIPPEAQAQIETMQRQMQAMHLQMETSKVNQILDGLATQIVLDRSLDFDTLIKCAREEDRTAIVQHWLNVRRPVEAQLPVEGVPLQMQMQGPRTQQLQPLTLQHAHDALALPGDPALRSAPAASAPVSAHERIMQLVRNRKQGQSVQEAYNALMGTVAPSVRG